MTITDITTPLRHERDLNTISGRITDVVNARLDVVAPQSSFGLAPDAATSSVGLPDPLLTPSGVISGAIEAPMTRTAWRQVCDRLKLPLRYADMLRESNDPTLLRLASHSVNELASVDQRTALFRYLRRGDETILRAVLSGQYQMLDNDVAFTSIIAGLTAHGLGLGDCQVDGDVTPDRLRLRITVPGIELLVPDLLGDYRMPFSMREDRGIHDRPEPGETPPVLWAGLEIGNSETGHGSFYAAPRAEVAICRNGLVKPIEFRRAHFGVALEDGVIDWSDETRRNTLELIGSQVTDAAKTFLSVGYLEAIAEEMRAAKGITVESPAKAVEVVQAQYGFTDAETASVLDCFMRGGDDTVLGVGQAVTAAAQLADNGDRQAEMEQTFWKIVAIPQAFASA